MLLWKVGGPLPGPESGLLSNTWKWTVHGDNVDKCADKARDFLGKGHPGGEQEGKGTQENYSATWLAVSGFTVMVFASMLSFSQSLWFRVLPGGARVVQPRWMPERGLHLWEVVGHVVSPFDLPVGGGLLVPCSLPGPPVLKLLREAYWLKLPILARHHSNYLHELFYDRRSC